MKWQRAKLYTYIFCIYIDHTLLYFATWANATQAVAFYLLHFAIKYGYPCMNLCLIAHLIALSSNQIHNHIHSFDNGFNL